MKQHQLHFKICRSNNTALPCTTVFQELTVLIPVNDIVYLCVHTSDKSSSLLCLRVTHLPCHPNLTDKTWYVNKRSKNYSVVPPQCLYLFANEIVDILVTWPRITPGGLQRVKEDLNWWNPIVIQWATKNKRCSWKWTEPTPVQGATKDLKCSRINFLRV